MKTGVLASYRENMALIREHVLTEEQYVLYEYCIHRADFDEKHDKFGTFQLSIKQIAEDLGTTDDSVRRWIRPLLLSGLIKFRGNNTFEITEYKRYLPTYAYKLTKTGEQTAFIQHFIAKLRTVNAELKNKSAKMRKLQHDSASNSEAISDTFPYKVGNSVTRTKKEYEQIIKEGDYSTFSVEDLSWIDQNTTEDPNVPS